MGAAFWFGIGALATALGAACVLAVVAWRIFGPGSTHWRRNAPGRCRSCGCTDIAACVGADGLPCYWIEPGLCSNCFPGRGIWLRPPYDEIPANSKPAIACENCDGSGEVASGDKMVPTVACAYCYGTGRS